MRATKVSRFLAALTDEQVMEFIAVLERTLATDGMNPTALRAAMIAFVTHLP